MRNWRSIEAVEPVEGSTPFWYMTADQFQTGIHELVRGGLILPYGLLPASRPGGVVWAACTSWAQWRKYEWNPPEFLPMEEGFFQDYSDSDINASPKPLWQEIRKAYEVAVPRLLREDLTQQLQNECRRRITLAYKADNINDEIFLRLRAAHTPKQDTERDRLLALYQTLKTRIGDSTLEELEAIDLADDDVWVNT